MSKTLSWDIAMLIRRKLAFLIAPLFPSIFLLFAFNLADLRQAIFVLIFSIPFSYLPCLLLGIPLARYLEKRNSLSVVTVTLCGAIFGALVFYGLGFVISTVLGSKENSVPILRQLASGALFGVSVALPFSLISGFPLWSTKR